MATHRSRDGLGWVYALVCSECGRRHTHEHGVTRTASDARAAARIDGWRALNNASARQFKPDLCRQCRAPRSNVTGA
ncbi:hypothetical protein CLV63_12911 [Murinocardiopsis flavida]|uniref:Uncharacterized protein n=1 Tax=Murinocardiopsis flavida TaxID=645275 RepID=A0A2P8CUS8_9ACTN|nr:hypothetical protein CLV63_12911 [Murinocardiopsis flavida]